VLHIDRMACEYLRRTNWECDALRCYFVSARFLSKFLVLEEQTTKKTSNSQE
jgi:hypothetical protein